MEEVKVVDELFSYSSKIEDLTLNTSFGAKKMNIGKYIFNKCQNVVHYIIYVVICMFVKF